MKRPYLIATLALIGTLAGFPAAAQTPYEIWVATPTARVLVVDHGTGAIAAPIDLSDPSIPDPPGCVAFSTTAASPHHAFVSHGPKIHVIDASTRVPLTPPRDIAALTGLPGLVLRGCDASVPRAFSAAAGGTTFRSHLFVAATSPTGGAHYVILDQDALIAGAPPVVAHGLLDATATPRDVTVLEAPLGPAFQRAWFGLTRGGAGSEVLSIPVWLPDNLAPTPVVTVGPPRVILTPTGPPDTVVIGAPLGRELPVLPGGNSGSVRNLDLDTSCALSGAPTAVSVTGPGPNSYSVLVTRPPNELLLVDPNDCTSDTIGVGLDPVDVVPLGDFSWFGAYVANRGSDSLSFVDVDGSVSTIPLGAGNAPVAIAVSQRVRCAVTGLRKQRLIADGDGVRNDIKLTWDPCPSSTQRYWVWCACLDDPLDCACACDCDLPVEDPACGCPAKGGGDGIDFLLNYPGDPVPDGIEFSKNPWKKLEDTPDMDYTHHNEGDTDPSWLYNVTGTKDPPPPPP